MYEYETAFFAQGLHKIAGTDEAGRGPLAGPVVAAAVILNPNDTIEGLNDSKQLSEKQRLRLAIEIKARAMSWSIAFVSPAEIDTINIYQASRKAMLNAIHDLAIQPDAALTDAMPLPSLSIPHLPIIHGDCLSASIAAASILAKVARDAYMVEQDLLYPGYGFAKHKGYPTKEHIEALNRQGITPIHRLTYQPVKDVMALQLRFDLGDKL